MLKETCMDWQVAGVSIAGMNDLGLLAICAIERDIQIPVASKESRMVRIIRSRRAACQSAARSRVREGGAIR
jgi:hypothetical protein